MPTCKNSVLADFQQKTNMANDNVTTSTRTGSRFAPRRMLRLAAIGTASLIVLYVFANWAWTMSGSGKWNLKIDKDGTQVYTMKVPGDPSIKVRGVTRSREFSLSTHLAPFFDEHIQENCGAWVEGCFEYRILKRWTPESQYNVTMWSVNLFPPFSPRQILLQGNLSQDPVTRIVTLENIAAPNKIPFEPCCVRLNHVHNVFKYTPLADGMIEVELIYDMDMGGLFPRQLLNLGAPYQVHKMLAVDTPKLLRRAAYRNARLDFIKEASTTGGSSSEPAVVGRRAPGASLNVEARTRVPNHRDPSVLTQPLSRAPEVARVERDRIPTNPKKREVAP